MHLTPVALDSRRQERYRKSNGKWSLKIMDIDTMDTDGPIIQMELLTKTGQKTVPNVFIAGVHVGGDSDVTELDEEGALDRMLEMLASA